MGAHPYMGVLFVSNKKTMGSSSTTTYANLMIINTKCRKPGAKGTVLQNLTGTALLQRHNYGHGGHLRVWQGLARQVSDDADV